MGLGPFGARKKRESRGRAGVSGEAIARHLARRLDESGQPAATRVTVAELHKVLLPYPECREALGFATKAEYDVALLRFLESGAYVQIDESGLTEAVEEELASPEPGLAFLKNFAAAQLRLRRAALPAPGRDGGADGAGGDGSGAGDAAAGDAAAGGAGAGDGEPTGLAEPQGAEQREGAGQPEGAEAGVSASDSEAPADAGSGSDAWLESLERPAAPGEANGRAAESAPRTAAGGACRACGEALPGRPGLRFCPRCGADQRVARCGRCGEDLEAEWAFCPRCGSAADGG